MGISFQDFLWLGCDKNIKYKSENSHIVGIDKVMVPPTELFKCWH